MEAYTVYLILSSGASFCFSLIFTVNLVYHVTVVGLDPLQLVLVGTILEASVFLFEIPTGIVADVKSRRLSIIIGYLLIGLGFIVEGSFPFFLAVALAQGLWGLGYTFTSGATQAWIVDEIGEVRAGNAFLRGAQARQIGALCGIPVSVALAGIAIPLPIVLGGALMSLLAMFLIFVMPEKGFSPTAVEDRTRWDSMLDTVKNAREMTKRQPILLVILGIGLFYGLYSEGIDRLWTAHLLQNFSLPVLGVLKPVAWFGIIRAVALALGFIGVETARRRIDVSRSIPIIRALMCCAGLIIAALAGFALTQWFWAALSLFWLFGALRSIINPLEDVWLNRNIDAPEVRATIFSVRGQMDAIGQVCGGPGVGAIGKYYSIRIALIVSAFLLSPVLPLYSLTIRRRTQESAKKV